MVYFTTQIKYTVSQSLNFDQAFKTVHSGEQDSAAHHPPRGRDQAGQHRLLPRQAGSKTHTGGKRCVGSYQ